MKSFLLLSGLIVIIISSTTIEEPVKRNYLPKNNDKALYGVASYYDYTIGDWSSIGHFVCATRDFIRYSFVRATNVANGKSVEVCVMDYGPDESIFPKRIIDLSSTAFAKISSTKTGIANVSVRQLNKKCK